MTDRSFNACYRNDARILVLGSLPGKRSIEAQRYYAHPRNAFWPILCDYLSLDKSVGYDVSLHAAIEAGVALWDVVSEAERPGSLDSAIKPSSVVFNPIAGLIDTLPSLHSVLLNGGKAMTLFKQAGLKPVCEARGICVQQMPSTSPAFAAISVEQKKRAWISAFESALSR